MAKEPEVKMIPVEQIRVLNPRTRNKRKFKQIVDNISRVGLKKPVTVSLRGEENGQPVYDLVCGQGRFEAFVALGQKEVPALLVDASLDDRMIMSLVENIARRQPLTLDSLRNIQALKERGYTDSQIAQKVDLTVTYVKDVLKLFAAGEEDLLRAVETEKIPISIATMIAASDDKEIQSALQDAYEKNQLRGNSLAQARRLVEQRKLHGKKGRTGRAPAQAPTSESVVAAMQVEADRQRMLLRKASQCETSLLIISSALQRLLADQAFVDLLQSESLATMPKFLADDIRSRSRAAKD